VCQSSAGNVFGGKSSPLATGTIGTDLNSEIKCYGSYILPVLIVFGLLVIGVSLGVVGWKKGWFS
jgi:hypothetical protein